MSGCLNRFLGAILKAFHFKKDKKKGMVLLELIGLATALPVMICNEGIYLQ